MPDASVGSRNRSADEGTVVGTGAERLFTFPWPGPGNSEGPVDPDQWLVHVDRLGSTDRAAVGAKAIREVGRSC